MTATDPGLPDFLNWCAFVAPGVIRNRDDALLRAWELWGPDQEYADYESMEALANQLNRDLAKLSSGWMLQVEAIRAAVVVPPATTVCPDPTSQLMAEERATEYAAAGTHFKQRLVLTLVWLPPLQSGQRLSRLLFGQRRIGAKPSQHMLLSIFQRESQHVVDALSHFLKLEPLTNEELKKFLYYCLTGEDKPIGSAPSGGMVNYATGAVEMEPHRGIVNGRHTRVVGVYGFPQGTFPQMLTDVLQLPMELRLSQRFIFLSSRKAVKELERKRNTWGYKNWYNPKQIAWERSRATKNAYDPSVVRRNTDADNQVESVEQEITGLEAGQVRGGYYTLVVVLRDVSEDTVNAHTAEIIQLLNHKGFKAIDETDNFPAAFKGSIPGHGTSNVRKPRLTTDHIARLLTWSSPWRGYDTHPSSLYPKHSGPLLICKSTGNTPFFFTPTLHTAVIGPNGSGKTTLFNAASMAHLQYPNAQVFTLDNGAGGSVPCWAAGGEVFDLDAKKYAPLAHIHLESEYAWALDFCERLVKLRDTVLTGQGRLALRNALQDLAKAPVSHRTMTGLLGQLQTSDEELRAALSHYAGMQPGAIIDGQYHELVDKRWLNFDMEQVQKRSESVRIPVLLAQLHELDRRMENNYPTQIFIDEGGLAVGDVLLRDFIQTDSIKFRKKIVSMWLVLHSPEAFKLFPQAGQLLNNIGTYIFLPNEMADTDALRPGYQALGLGRREITKIAEAIPRRQYYVVEKAENQRRMFALPWGRWSQALFGIDGRIVKPRILELRQQYGEQWLPPWLIERGFPDLVTQYQQRQQQQQEAA